MMDLPPRTQAVMGPPTPSSNQQVLALRTREAAEALGISERTLQTLVSAGEIPHVKLGRATLFPVHELRDWLTARVVAGEVSAEPTVSEGGTR